MTDRRLAGIDIGTLTCRLLIADFQPNGSLTERHADRRILRLGEGVDEARRLNEPAIERVIDCLKEWARVIDDYRVDGISVVATSAVRDAENRDDFRDRLHRETGFGIEIITGQEEARRTVLGIRAGLPKSVDGMLGLDIGGGSTEFIVDQSGRPPEARSIDIGVVRLCERVLRHDPPTTSEVESAREWIRRETTEALAGLPRCREATLVGTAGTITSLAAMAQELPVYVPARIQNYRLRLEVIRLLEQDLLSRSKRDRTGLPGLESGREEVIAAGAIMVRTIMETIGEDECLVSEWGLREGVLIDLANKQDGRSPHRAQ